MNAFNFTLRDSFRCQRDAAQRRQLAQKLKRNWPGDDGYKPWIVAGKRCIVMARVLREKVGFKLP